MSAKRFSKRTDRRNRLTKLNKKMMAKFNVKETYGNPD